MRPDRISFIIGRILINKHINIYWISGHYSSSTLTMRKHYSYASKTIEKLIITNENKTQ